VVSAWTSRCRIRASAGSRRGRNRSRVVAPALIVLGLVGILALLRLAAMLEIGVPRRPEPRRRGEATPPVCLVRADVPVGEAAERSIHGRAEPEAGPDAPDVVSRRRKKMKPEADHGEESYRGSGKLEGLVGDHHRRRQRDRPRGGDRLRPRGRRRRHRLPGRARGRGRGGDPPLGRGGGPPLPGAPLRRAEPQACDRFVDRRSARSSGASTSWSTTRPTRCSRSRWRRSPRSRSSGPSAPTSSATSSWRRRRSRT
jgi:hypothetical protein